MSNEYLLQRDARAIAQANKLLDQLPDFVREFYDSKTSEAELTRLAYVRDVREFLVYLSKIHDMPPENIPIEILNEQTAQDIDAYKKTLIDNYAAATAKRKIASLSVFFKFLVIRQYATNNPASIIEWPKEPKNRAIIYLDADQTRRLVEGVKANDLQIYYNVENTGFDDKDIKGSLKGSPVGKDKLKYTIGEISEKTKKRRDKIHLRNYCIILLFLKTGIRVSELVSINVDDINFRTNIINVTGKGNKTRPVGFGEDEIVKTLRNYINTDRRKLISKNPKEKALFVSTSGKRLSVRSVETMIKEMVMTYLYDDATINTVDFSPHKLRSTCATRLLKDTGGNIKAVSEFLGHESIEITARRYAAISREENAQEMAKNKML